MATVFKFIVEDKATKTIGKEVQVDANGVVLPKDGAGTQLASFTGSNKGVEHNRYLRAINPILNRYTGGMWEKGTRMYRAGLGVIDTAKNSGVGAALTSVGAILIAQLIIMESVKAIEKAIKEAKEDNQANFFKIKNGTMLLSRDADYRKNIFGKVIYSNQ